MFRASIRTFMGIFWMLALAALVAAGCGSDSKSGGNPKDDRGDDPAAEVQELMVNIGDESEPGNFDPSTMSYLDSANAKVNPLFAGLYRVIGDDSVLTPHLATGPVKVSEDGMTYTIEIRDDAKWSDGKPVTADDVVTGIRHSLDPESGSYFATFMVDIVGGCELINGKEAKANCPDRELTDGSPEAVGAKALDDTTVEVSLIRPVPWFDQLLAVNTFTPLRADLLEKFGKDWTKPENIVTSGPFTLEEYKVGDKFVVAKNPEYFDADNVKLDKITFRMVKEATTAAAEFTRGDLDTGLQNLMFDAAEVDKWKATEFFISTPTVGVQYLWLNTTNPKLKDPKVRQGIALAIDRKSIVENITKRGDTPANTVVPISVPGSDVWGEGAQDFLAADGSPDVDAAKEHLKEGGWKDGDALTIYYASDGSSGAQIAELIQSNLGEVGIKAQLKPTTGDVFSTPGIGISPTDAKVDSLTQGWIQDYLDAQDWYQLFICSAVDGGLNSANYCSKEFDEVYNEALKTVDTDARFDLYRDLEAKLSGPDGDMPAVPLYNQADATLLQPWVANFDLTPSGLIYWDDVFVTEEKDKE